MCSYYGDAAASKNIFSLYDYYENFDLYQSAPYFANGTYGQIEFDYLSNTLKFDGQVQEVKRPQFCLEVIENNDPVFLDNRGGNKLQIAGKEFDRGLYCHAPSHINVFPF